VEYLTVADAVIEAQQRNVFEYLTEACEAALRGDAAPSLLGPNPTLKHEPQTAWNTLLSNELWRGDFLGHRESLTGVR
jgi:hypothetical protein